MAEKDAHDERIKEMHNFLAWLNKQIPAGYRRMNETPQCFSPIRDYTAISDVACQKVRDNLIEADRQIISGRKSGFAGLVHVLGKEPCERCMRILNARAVHIVRHHPEIFTEAAHKLAWLDLSQRHKEQKQESAYDSLYLLQSGVPYRGCPTLKENELLFCDDVSLAHGKKALTERLKSHPSILQQCPELIEALCFGDTALFRLPGISQQFHSAASYAHLEKDRGYDRTTVRIIAKR